MALNLKLPKFFTGSNSSADQTVSATTLMDDDQPLVTRKSGFGLGFLGQYTVTKQLQILGGILLLMMVIIAIVIYLSLIHI